MVIEDDRFDFLKKEIMFAHFKSNGRLPKNSEWLTTGRKNK